MPVGTGGAQREESHDEHLSDVVDDLQRTHVLHKALLLEWSEAPGRRN